ncbi:MAG TPA: cytidylate kinase family protein [Xanthobacteraceae bacterium]|jgi:cytidylate kinase|nr:cytidylate kinase family protein [Xanthobacteraceae bacterium]
MTVIAMTRQPGSLGSEVANGIAGRLGLKIIHSEIVANNVAERLGVEESAVLRYVDGSAALFERLAINRRKFSRYTAEEILSIAQQGRVLIRGWGAATLLRDMPHVISVRVCASMNFRVRVMMERSGAKNAEEVREHLERMDAAQARAMRASFNVEHEDALLYHIVLNTDRLPIDACVNAVCELARHRRFRDPATVRAELADKLLEAKVNSALTDEISIGAAPTGVAVSAANGRITLVGTSSSGALRERAERIAHQVPGVRHIDNRIVSVPNRGRIF